MNELDLDINITLKSHKLSATFKSLPFANQKKKKKKSRSIHLLVYFLTVKPIDYFTV